MNQLTPRPKEKSITIIKLHPRVIAGINGTPAGVEALRVSLERSGISK